MKCAADQSQTCGGGWANQVYDVTGHRSKHIQENPFFFTCLGIMLSLL